MTEFAQWTNTILSVFTIAMQGVAILLLLGMACQSPLLERIRTYGIHIALVIAGSAMGLSLVYSNVIGFPPCSLCVVQRLFLYPQVIVLAFALWKQSRAAINVSLLLSIIGGIIAAYHYYGQMFDSSILTCVTGATVSCAQRYFVEFGYITLPMMSFTTFVLLIELLLIKKIRNS